MSAGSPHAFSATTAGPDSGRARHSGLPTATLAVLATVAGAVVVAPLLADKHHYAAKHLSGRIAGGALLWLLVSALIFGALLGVAWLTRELRSRGHTRLLAEPASWIACLALGIAVSGVLYATRTHFHYSQVGPRITSAIVLAVLFALGLRLALLLGAFVLRADRTRGPFGA